MRIETEELIRRYQDRIFAAAFQICKNAADAEDVVQETFLKYHLTSQEFESEQHIRAWLIRVAINQAKNITRSFWRHTTVPLEDYMDSLCFDSPMDRDLMTAVMALPQRYRIVIHLFYFEESSIREIAGILHLTESTVKVRLNRGRKMLKSTLKEEWNND